MKAAVRTHLHPLGKGLACIFEVNAGTTGAAARIDDRVAAAEPAAEATPLWRKPRPVRRDARPLLALPGSHFKSVRPSLRRIRRRNPSRTAIACHYESFGRLRFRNGRHCKVQIFPDRAAIHTWFIERCRRPRGDRLPRDPELQRRLRMHDREAHCKTDRGACHPVRDGPRSRPDHARGAGPHPEVRRERIDQGGARFSDRALLRPVQEHAHHHPARRNDTVRVAGRDRRRGHHRRDRAVLRRAQLRAGVPRRQCPQGAEEDAGADDQGPARRRGHAHCVTGTRPRRHHAAGGRRPHTGGCAPGGDSLSQV